VKLEKERALAVVSAACVKESGARVSDEVAGLAPFF